MKEDDGPDAFDDFLNEEAPELTGDAPTDTERPRASAHFTWFAAGSTIFAASSRAREARLLTESMASIFGVRLGVLFESSSVESRWW